MLLFYSVASNAVEYFDGVQWKFAPGYPFPVSGHAAAAISPTEILSCGGDFLDDHYDVVSTCFKISREPPRPAQDMPVPRAKFAMASVDGPNGKARLQTLKPLTSLMIE